MSKAGSLFRAKMGNRYFVFTTAHQFVKDGYDYNQLCLLDYDSNRLTSSNKVVFPNETETSIGECDFLAFDFTVPMSNKSLKGQRWYDLRRDFSVDYTPEPSRAVAIGFPSHRNVIDYDHDHYGASPNAVWGFASQSSISNRLAFEVDPEISFDPSGMSGSPVFGISKKDVLPSCFFAGIVTEASNKRFNFISLRSVRPLVSRLLEQGV